MQLPPLNALLDYTSVPVLMPDRLDGKRTRITVLVDPLAYILSRARKDRVPARA